MKFSTSKLAITLSLLVICTFHKKFISGNVDSMAFSPAGVTMIMVSSCHLPVGPNLRQVPLDGRMGLLSLDLVEEINIQQPLILQVKW